MFNKSLQKAKIKKKDEVLIPTICWSTSLWPIVQSGLKPVFVDVDVNTLNINTKDLEKKINQSYNVSPCSWQQLQHAGNT